LDIDQLPQVVNFDLPNVAEDYVHRIGGTGRAGASGQAVSLVSAEEFKQLKDIEQLIGKTIEREIVNSFEPQEALPESRLNPNKIGPKKPKKPKKPKEGHQDGQRSGNLDKGNGNKPANAENRHRRPAQGAKTEGSSARRKPANAKPQGGRSQESKPQGAGKGNSGSGPQRNNQGRTSQQRDSQARGSRQRNER